MAFAFAAAVSAVPGHSHVIEGSATVIDGDTIDMTGTRIRIAYVNAPEAPQRCTGEGEEWPCGVDATAELSSIINGQRVACAVIEADTYGRQVATCQTSRFNLGLEMVRRGLAVPVEGAPIAYEDEAAIAKRMSFGLWASTFALSREWQSANPQATAKVAQRDPVRQGRSEQTQERIYRDRSGCLIKGNRNRRGEWIYHLPGRSYYDATRAEEMFCTEKEAQAAGCRRSRA